MRDERRAELSIREIMKPFLEEVIIAIDPEGRGLFVYMKTEQEDLLIVDNGL